MFGVILATPLPLESYKWITSCAMQQEGGVQKSPPGYIKYYLFIPGRPVLRDFSRQNVCFWKQLGGVHGWSKTIVAGVGSLFKKRPMYTHIYTGTPGVPRPAGRHAHVGSLLKKRPMYTHICTGRHAQERTTERNKEEVSQNGWSKLRTAATIVLTTHPDEV